MTWINNKRYFKPVRESKNDENILNKIQRAMEHITIKRAESNTTKASGTRAKDRAGVECTTPTVTSTKVMRQINHSIIILFQQKKSIITKINTYRLGEWLNDMRHGTGMLKLGNYILRVKWLLLLLVFKWLLLMDF